jgi:hypothetical protein
MAPTRWLHARLWTVTTRIHPSRRLPTRQNGNVAEIYEAHALLKVPSSYTAKELRAAYLTQCRLLHPDNSVLDKAAATELFMQMASAHDLLRRRLSDKGPGEANMDANSDKWDDAYDMSEKEEESYRQACQISLSVTAEIVEDAKSTPEFRMWLLSKSEAAARWLSFFHYNGGIIPIRLRNPSAGAIDGRVRPKKR